MELRETFLVIIQMFKMTMLVKIQIKIQMQMLNSNQKKRLFQM